MTKKEKNIHKILKIKIIYKIRSIRLDTPYFIDKSSKLKLFLGANIEVILSEMY